MVLYKCDRCGKQFKKKSNYESHKNRKKPCKKISHKTSSKSSKNNGCYQCPQCTKTYSSKYNLNRHSLHYCKVLVNHEENEKTNTDLKQSDNCTVESVICGDIISIEIENWDMEISDEKCDTKTVNGITKTVNGITKTVNTTMKIICKYCKKELSAKRSLKRHYKACKMKPKRDLEVTTTIEKNNLVKKIKDQGNKLEEKDNKLEEKDTIIKQYEEKLQEIEREYFNFTKKMAEKDGGNKTVNNNTFNMFFVLNNYDEAYNIEELMDPPLTEDEIKYILLRGAIAGCYKLILNRCIDNIKLEKRPLHCVDSSRNKYLLHTENEWSIDLNGSKLLRGIYPKVRSVFDLQINEGDSPKRVNEVLKNMEQIRDLELYGEKRILKYLNRKTLLKNNAPLALKGMC